VGNTFNKHVAQKFVGQFEKYGFTSLRGGAFPTMQKFIDGETFCIVWLDTSVTANWASLILNGGVQHNQFLKVAAATMPNGKWFNSAPISVRGYLDSQGNPDGTLTLGNIQEGHNSELVDFFDDYAEKIINWSNGYLDWQSLLKLAKDDQSRRALFNVPIIEKILGTEEFDAWTAYLEHKGFPIDAEYFLFLERLRALDLKSILS